MAACKSPLSSAALMKILGLDLGIALIKAEKRNFVKLEAEGNQRMKNFIKEVRKMEIRLGELIKAVGIQG